MRNVLRSAAVMATALSTFGLVAEAENTGLKGTLILEENEPMELDRLVRFDMATGTMAMEAEGYDGNTVASGFTVFIARCGDYNVDGQLTVMDPDGFQQEVGPCLNNSSLGGLQQSRISPSGKYVAVYDGDIQVPMGGAADDFGLTVGRGGVRIYDVDGNEVSKFLGVGTISWGPDDRLYTAGLGESDTGQAHGVYRFSEDFQSIERIDDGRLNGAIYSLEVHPSGLAAMFVYNNQMWSIDFETGKPRRELRFDFPIAHLAWNPEGTKVAFVVSDPIDEGIRRPGSDYFIHVYDGKEVNSIGIPFIPGGPMSWVE